jgi:hypothetical protein
LFRDCDLPRLTFKSGVVERADPLYIFKLTHAAGLWLQPSSHDAQGQPDVGAFAVLSDIRFSSDETLRPSGSIENRSTCLGPDVSPFASPLNPPNGTPLTFRAFCDDPSQKFEFTLRGSLRHVSSGKCVRPLGGATNPTVGTQLVLFTGCDLDRVRFADTWR